jgi:hypothetical protein
MTRARPRKHDDFEREPDRTFLRYQSSRSALDAGVAAGVMDRSFPRPGGHKRRQRVICCHRGAMGLPLALLSLGDLYEAIKKPELANKAYERVLLNSPLHRYAQPYG